MDEQAPDEPLVVIVDEIAPPLSRRRLWPLWGALAGVLLLAAVGAGLFSTRGRRPAPRPALAEVIAFAGVPPAPLESPSAPPDAVDQTPAALPPPRPPRDPSPARPEPRATSPAVEPPVPSEEPPPEFEETPADPPPPAPASRGTRVEAPASPAPALGETIALEAELGSAAAAIGDATPIFSAIADSFDPPDFRKGDVLELAVKIDRAEEKLAASQRIYARVKDRAPDPALLERRLETIRGLLDSLREARARIRVPWARRKAEMLEGEALPLAKEAAEGFQPFSREAQVLDVRAEVAAGKLREACQLYGSIRKDVPDPDRVDERLKSLDAVVQTLEARFPETKEAR